MKRKQQKRWSPPPQPGGETFQVIIITPTAKDYCIPLPEKRTLVKPVPMGDWLGRVVLNAKKKIPKAKS